MGLKLLQNYDFFRSHQMTASGRSVYFLPSEGKGRTFESYRVRQFSRDNSVV
jgi:hypothetical protein